jgi:hypothetical protein
VRVVYAIPADGADNFASSVNGIATDAEWIDEWWQAQDPTRTPRFDRYPFPGCTTKMGDLDIGFVRLPHNGAYYTAGDTSQFYKLTSDLQNTLPDNEKTIVYYDGPDGQSDLCGVSNSDEAQYGGLLGVAYVFLQSGCNIAPAGTGGSAQTAAHEFLHDIGALPAGAPHPCPGDDGHPCDSATDVLYPYYTSGSTLDTVTLDFGRDDYYGHKGTWLDTRNSAWLEHLPQYPYTLASVGEGSVTARVDDVKLPCDDGCSGIPLDNGTEVVAQAVPKPGWRVGGWQGACAASSDTCDSTISGPTAATVTFVRAPVDVALSVSGKGTVRSSPGGLNCARICKHSFAPGSTVTLRATAARGWRFTGWSGVCSGRRVSCRLPAEGGGVRAKFIRS